MAGRTSGSVGGRAKLRGSLAVAAERWPIAGRFTLSRGAKFEAQMVVATIRDGPYTGRAECVPYGHYGESIEGVMRSIEALAPRIARGLVREELATLLPPGAARNALDCALWDLEAKLEGTSVAALAGLAPLRPVETALTISLASPQDMATRARAASDFQLLKLKLGGNGDAERLAAVRAAVPNARLIADANEAWGADTLEQLLQAAADTRIALVEQPLPVGADAILERIERPVPICADESIHDRNDLAAVARRYDAVNIKLDKTGGLTEALATAASARALGLKIMAGCMVATSLAMAPALLVAQGADFVDLDGPLLLERDRALGLIYRSGKISPPSSRLWG